MFGIKHVGFKGLYIVVTGMLLCGQDAKGYLLVEDIPNLSTNIVNEVKNYVQYLSQTANQVTQITNQVTQIENQVIALERFGNPQYYVNMLGLSSFMATASVLTSGVGQTISGYRQAANGVLALGYTGNGLYSNLTGSLDRYGNPVRYNTDAFRKFAAVNDMVEGYNTEQRTFNAQMASLQQQLTTAMQNLNAASTQMETEKYAAQVNAIHAQINALSQTTNLTGQRAAVQQLSNQNDAARPSRDFPRSVRICIVGVPASHASKFSLAFTVSFVDAPTFRKSGMCCANRQTEPDPALLALYRIKLCNWPNDQLCRLRRCFLPALTRAPMPSKPQGDSLSVRCAAPTIFFEIWWFTSVANRRSLRRRLRIRRLADFVPFF